MTDDELATKVDRCTPVMTAVAAEMLLRNVRDPGDSGLDYAAPMLREQAEQGLYIESALALVAGVVAVAGAMASEARLRGFHPERWLRAFAAELEQPTGPG